MEPADWDVTEAELAVLQTLWDRGTSTTRDLTDVLYPGGTSSHFCTVQKLLERLESKECVRRDRSHWPQRFTALVDRKTLIDRSLRTLAEKLCGGSLTPLLTHLLDTDDFTDSERTQLRSYLNKLTRKPKTSGDRP
jgi:predicted transcriptional regulator